MAIKISELPDINTLDFNDTFLVVDRDEYGNVNSKQVTFQNLIKNLDDFGTNNYNTVNSAIVNLETHLENLIANQYSNVSARIANLEDRELTSGLSFGQLYVENLTAGVPQ